VWHESFKWHDSFTCVTWVIWVETLTEMTQPYVWHDSDICVTWLIDVCAITRISSSYPLNIVHNIRSRNLVSVCTSHTESMRSLYSINLRAYVRTCAQPPPSTITPHKRHRLALSFSSVCFLSLCLSRMHAPAHYVHTTHRLAAWACVSIQAPYQVCVCVCVYVFVCVCVCVRECV